MTERTWEEFEEYLDRSVDAVFIFAKYLHKKSITVRIPGLKKRGQNGVPNDYKDDGDLFIVWDDGTEARIEIKGVNTQFTSRYDYPHPFMIISAKHRVDKVKDEVKRWVILSKDRKHFASINKNTQSTWYDQEIYSRNSRKYEKFCVAPLDSVEWFTLE